jgi:hypothetical protein
MRLDNRSLHGILRPLSDVSVSAEEWPAARARAWAEAAPEKEVRLTELEHAQP